jgi:hypothetical protein
MNRMPSLDAWLPEPAIRTHHRRAAAADPARLWECAARVRLTDTKTLGRLVRWRIPGTPPQRTFHEVLRDYPFAVLEERENVLLSGLCGRIWTRARDYPRLRDSDEFRRWREPGTVRVLLAHWAEGAPGGRAQIVSEARVAPVDAAAGRKLRAIWAVVGPFQRLVGAEGLAVAARRAEGR